MSKLPLVEGIENYINEKNISFCMPGHKNGKGFISTKEGKQLYNNFIKGDITEVDGVDNLHDAEGIIKEAQDKLSSYYGSKKSYFLVNGSTCGNLTMIFSSFNEGDKILVERNCHRSIYNGIIMRKLKPVYIKNSIDLEYDAPFSIDKEHFLSVLEDNKDAKGIVITYPNYYGICCDLELVIKKAKEYKMKVLVDCAHGAHFGVSEKLPKNPLLLGADMVVMSAHKTLPSVTQTAFLHVNSYDDIEKVNFYVSAFMSTSPSYMFLTSMDYARYYLEEYGENQYHNLIKLVKKYIEKINAIKGFKCLDKEYVNKNYGENADFDSTRLVINLEKGYSGHKLLDYLRSQKLQCEMSTNRAIVLIPSPFNCQEDFEKLYEALKCCDLDFIKEEYVKPVDNIVPEQGLYPYEVMYKEKEYIDLHLSEGRVAATSVVPYPPGVPIIMSGEIINSEAIEILNYSINNGVTVLGLKENKILVVQ